MKSPVLISDFQDFQVIAFGSANSKTLVYVCAYFDKLKESKNYMHIIMYMGFEGYFA